MAVSFDKLFDLDKSVADLNLAIQGIEKLGSVYANTLTQMTNELKLLTKAQSDLVKSVEETQKAQKKLDVQTEEGRKEAVKSAKQTDVQKEQYLFLTKQIKDLEGNIKALKSEENKFNKSREETLKNNRDLIALQTKLTNLESEEAQEIAKLRTAIQQKNKELKESAKESLQMVSLYQKETKVLNDLRKEYKDVAIQYGVNSKEAKELQKRVIELDSSIKEIDANAGQFQRNVGNYPELFQQMGGAMGTAASGVGTLGTSLKALAANPVGAVIVAIVGAVSLLFAGFKKLTGGAEFLEKAIAGLSITFSTLIGRIGKVISGEISLKEFLFETDDAIREQIKSSNQLIEIRRELDQDTAALNLSEAKYAQTIAKLSSIRDNDTKSLKQREEAGKLFLEATRRQNQERLYLADREMEAAGLALRTTEEGTEDRRKAEIEYTNALAEQVKARTEAYSEEKDAMRELEMIRLDQFEQELDLLLDIEDRRKTVNERTIADEETTLAKKQELLRINVQSIESSYKKQIAIFKEFFNVQLDEQKILELSGEELYRYTANLGLSERAVNRLREVVIEKLAADRDNLDTIRDVNDALETQRMIESDLTKATTENAKTRTEINKELQEQGSESWTSYYDQIKEKARETYQSSAQFLRDNIINGLTTVQEKINEVGGTLLGVLANITAIQTANDQKRIEELEAKKERELEIAGDNAMKKENIEKRYDSQIAALEKKKAERQRKNAIFEKALNITNSIINTAKAVTESLPNIPLSIAVGIIGGLKTAAIAAQPIPQYKDGTDYHQGGLAIVGDGGRSEVIQGTDGRMYVTPNKPTLVDMPQGYKVFDSIMSAQNKIGNLDLYKTSIGQNEKKIEFKMNDYKLDEIKNAITNLPIEQWHIKDGKLKKLVKKGRNTYWGNVNRF